MHWQNLNERPGDVTGPPISGRVWFGESCVEWAFDRFSRFGFSAEVEDPGGDYDLHFALHFGGSIYFMTRLRRLRRFLPRSGCCELTLVTHDGPEIHCGLWSRPMEWRSYDPWWRKNRVFFLRDIVMGQPGYSERVVEQWHDVSVPMLEGAYPARARLYEATWSRSRWFPKRLMRVEITIERGIPHEGKGENSWDCGEDATFGLTVAAPTIEAGIGELVGSVLRSRKRHGGAHTHRDLGVAVVRGASAFAPSSGDTR